MCPFSVAPEPNCFGRPRQECAISVSIVCFVFWAELHQKVVFSVLLRTAFFETVFGTIRNKWSKDPNILTKGACLPGHWQIQQKCLARQCVVDFCGGRSPERRSSESGIEPDGSSQHGAGPGAPRPLPPPPGLTHPGLNISPNASASSSLFSGNSLFETFEYEKKKLMATKGRCCVTRLFV